MRYSIILPVHNGMPFLQQAVASVLRTSRSDFEVIISDDSSSDGSSQFIKEIRDERVRVLEPRFRLSMAEHWDWAQTHASGRWQMFLGQDDGIQDFFFEMADLLTHAAERKGLRAVTARRAYIYWPGLGEAAPRHSVVFRHRRGHSVRSAKVDRMLALLSLRSYHSLPQMYTSSLLHKDLIDRLRNSQGGRLIVAQPQDASIAASVISSETKYVHGLTPISWVGTSSSSAGLAVLESRGKSPRFDELRVEYERTVHESRIKYPSWAGDFSIGDNAIYFWQALSMVLGDHSRPDGVMRNRILIMLVLSGGYLRIAPASPKFQARQKELEPIVRHFALNRFFLRLLCSVFSISGFVIVSIWRFGRDIRRNLTATHSAAHGSDLIRAYGTYGLDLQSINEQAFQKVRRYINGEL